MSTAIAVVIVVGAQFIVNLCFIYLILNLRDRVDAVEGIERGRSYLD